MNSSRLKQSIQSNHLNQTSRLVLGTAQLGMTYGIANKFGRPDADLAKQIIKTAWEQGIREYDTAQGYGESENVLGNALRSLGLSFDANIITKLDPKLDLLDKDALEQAVRESLTRLGRPRLHGLMLHREEYLEIWEKGLGEILKSFIKEGLTERLGISVYSPEMAMLALETDGIDMVQLPSNIFDRRFEKAGVFDFAEEMGKRVYVRSVFLQGLVMINAEKLPEHMSFALPVLKKLEALSMGAGLTMKELALGYVKRAYPNVKILFGAETPRQIEENVGMWRRNPQGDFVEQARELFDDVEPRVLNPVLWRRQ
jgi:aryl-alcohol dehydrogenase-like predicted oxidoreductase